MTIFIHSNTSYPIMEYNFINYKIEKTVENSNPDFITLLKNRDKMVDGKSQILCGIDMVNFTDNDYMDMI